MMAVVDRSLEETLAGMDSGRRQAWRLYYEQRDQVAGLESDLQFVTHELFWDVVSGLELYSVAYNLLGGAPAVVGIWSNERVAPIYEQFAKQGGDAVETARQVFSALRWALPDPE